MDLKQLAEQLRKPEGETGRNVGEMMNNGNQLINKWCIEEVDVEENDIILEIGMGNGYFIKDILRFPSVKYHGVDYAEIMIEEARRINKNVVESGQVELHHADVSALPFSDNMFSKIFTINTIYFWEDAKKQIAELKRVCKPGGKIVFAIRSKEAMGQMPFTEFGFVKYSEAELQHVLELNGLTVTHIFSKSEPPYMFNNENVQLENIIASCTV